MGMEVKRIALPSIQRDKQLPVVLSQPEIRVLLKTPRLLRHRMILAVMYDCGLRISEVCKIKIADIDLDRKMLHIRKSKGRKDRYVPISDMTIRGIRKYLEAEKPQIWLFNGQKTGAAYSTRGIQFVIRQARKKSGIQKAFTAHTLRHSYATHLLEMGTHIVTLQRLLGHEHIQTTMIYLQTAQLDRQAGFAPLDRIYDQADKKA